MLPRRRRGPAGDDHIDSAQAQIRRCAAAVYGRLVGEPARSGFRALCAGRCQAIARIADRSWNAGGGSVRSLQRQHQCGRAALAGRVSIRPSGRAPDELRELSFQRGYTKHAEGSVLVGFGATRVLRTVTIDCDVLQADGGTRTAAITGGFVALADAIDTLLKRRAIAANPLHGQVAAVSVGIYRGTPVLDLDYAEDSNAETDMNVVMNSGGAFVEVQGTAEGHAFRRHELDQLLDLAAHGIAQLHAAQLTARAP